jgi:hypothetical protein
MITIGDDGFTIITSLLKFSKIKSLNMNTICREKNLYTQMKHVSRKLKCIAITTELAASQSGNPLTTCEKIIELIPEDEEKIIFNINANDERNTRLKDENYRNNGNLAIGTTCGEVILLPIGKTV